MNGYHHFLAVGRAEQREGGTILPDWDEVGYLQVNPDVASRIERGEFLSGYHHYLAVGRSKGLLGDFAVPLDEAGYSRRTPRSAPRSRSAPSAPVTCTMPRSVESKACCGICRPPTSSKGCGCAGRC